MNFPDNTFDAATARFIREAAIDWSAVASQSNGGISPPWQMMEDYQVAGGAWCMGTAATAAWNARVASFISTPEAFRLGLVRFDTVPAPTVSLADVVAGLNGDGGGLRRPLWEHPYRRWFYQNSPAPVAFRVGAYSWVWDGEALLCSVSPEGRILPDQVFPVRAPAEPEGITTPAFFGAGNFWHRLPRTWCPPGQVVETDPAVGFLGYCVYVTPAHARALSEVSQGNLRVPVRLARYLSQSGEITDITNSRRFGRFSIHGPFAAFGLAVEARATGMLRMRGGVRMGASNHNNPKIISASASVDPGAPSPEDCLLTVIMASGVRRGAGRWEWTVEIPGFPTISVRGDEYTGDDFMPRSGDFSLSGEGRTNGAGNRWFAAVVAIRPNRPLTLANGRVLNFGEAQQ